MKLYELQVAGEKEWIAANTTIEALQVYNNITDNDIWDFRAEDDLIEVPEEKWKDMIITFPDDPNEPHSNFAERMKKVIEPEYLASTVY